ncbi:MAG: hypothetical protein IPG06_09385 [Haliea sp.]|nr:hypothetical protein [Haliea sp.]
MANQVLPKLTEMLEAEIVGINVDTLPFQHLINKTEVGEAIENLSFKFLTLIRLPRWER